MNILSGYFVKIRAAVLNQDNGIHILKLLICRPILFPAFYPAILPEYQIRRIAGGPLSRKCVANTLNFNVHQFSALKFCQYIHNQQRAFRRNPVRFRG